MSVWLEMMYCASYGDFSDACFRGVQNPMKISDIRFLKTEPNWHQDSKTENSVSAVWYSKTDL